MKNRTAQVPHPIVQSEMFLPVMNPVSPFRRVWTNHCGDICTMQAPQSLNHYDLVNLLAFLHILQQSKSIELKDAGEFRYEIKMPLSLMYDVLSLKSTHQRRDMAESLKRMSRTSLEMQYKDPWKHGGCRDLLLTSLTGDLKFTEQRGRTGTLLQAFPLRGMIDDRMLTLDVDRMITLQQPLSRIVAFFVASKPKNGILMTWEDWMLCTSMATSLRHFKERLKIAFKELKKYGFTIEERDGGKSVLVSRP